MGRCPIRIKVLRATPNCGGGRFRPRFMAQDRSQSSDHDRADRVLLLDDALAVGARATSDDIVRRIGELRASLGVLQDPLLTDLGLRGDDIEALAEGQRAVVHGLLKLATRYYAARPSFSSLPDAAEGALGVYDLDLLNGAYQRARLSFSSSSASPRTAIERLLPGRLGRHHPSRGSRGRGLVELGAAIDGGTVYESEYRDPAVERRQVRCSPSRGQVLSGADGLRLPRGRHA